MGKGRGAVVLLTQSFGETLWRAVLRIIGWFIGFLKVFNYFSFKGVVAGGGEPCIEAIYVKTHHEDTVTAVYQSCKILWRTLNRV